MPRRPRPRLNATLRHGGAAATIAILALLVLSRWWMFYATVQLAPGRSITAALRTGCAVLAHNLSAPGVASRSPKLAVGRYPVLEGPRVDLWFSAASYFTVTSGPFSNRRGVIAIPLWSLALIPATCSVLAWRRRPRAPTACPCGYDRAGLPPGAPCPECAAAAT